MAVWRKLPEGTGGRHLRLAAMDFGAYVLILRLRQPCRLTIGRLGTFHFPAGYYLYAGSAPPRLLLARLERHRQKGKRPWWHIDYLTNCSEATISGALVYRGSKPRECRLYRWVSRLPGAIKLIDGFGASDCRDSCRTHLVYFREQPPLTRRKEFFSLQPRRFK